MNEKKYINKLFENYQLSDKSKLLFNKIVEIGRDKKEKVLQEFTKLKYKEGMSIALLALYRQQVNSGFVLSDPLKENGRKSYYDKKTGVEFIISFNPDRELRKNHKLLIKRGIIAKNIDTDKLINKKNGKPCYLCWKNINIQNPSEVLVKTKLWNEYYYMGANFAYITNNHFTIMNSKHIMQFYRKKILKIAISFIDKTNGIFRIIYNGRAGASIKEHEHLQATTEPFPIEKIIKGEKLFKTKNTDVYNPFYYIPLWIVESDNIKGLTAVSDKIISEWENIDKNNTINLIFNKKGRKYSVYIFLRDQRKLLSKGKTGAMASFEVGGRIVLSSQEEMILFKKGSLLIIKNFLNEVSPKKDNIDILRHRISIDLIGGNHE
jgi:hypothetical protein